jgi:2-oxoglutarate ferredoxin oxidoreductase subunit alpha
MPKKPIPDESISSESDKNRKGILMTAAELRHYNGKNGQKAYVAFKGIIYDVTESVLWKNGEHEEMHFAGTDLTEAMADAPHSDEVFSSFSVVGRLESEAPAEPKEREISSKESRRLWYRRYHPHPYSVHFPIALHFFAAGLDIAFFVNPKEVYEKGVFYAFFTATAMGAVAMVPGIFSWWVNYDFKPVRALMIKLYVAVITLLIGVVGLWLRIGDTNIAYGSSIGSLYYHFAVFVTVPTVVVLAYYGGKLTWGKNGSGSIHQEKISEREKAMNNTRHETAAETVPSRHLPTKETEYDVPSAASTGQTPAYPQHYEAAPRIETGLSKTHHKDLTLMIGGAAGSGIQSIESLLVEAFRLSGFHLFSTKEYMSRIRGGSNTVQLRIADSPVASSKWKTDLFFALDRQSIDHAKDRLGEHTWILGDTAGLEKEMKNLVPVQLEQKGRELGGRQFLNTYSVGVLFGFLGLNEELLYRALGKTFGDKAQEANRKALGDGFLDGISLSHEHKPSLEAPATKAGKKSRYMDGTTACGYGFLAGGCNFVASYPMSPSTGVLSFMAARSDELCILVEQAEDEIAAVNMVLGAWYAGGRALTTTSGGGFALMCESMSLSGMTETPAVIYLAQRPGPATGLPTRTEQGDLDLALHAGHGAFARVILAPGDLQECIDMGYLAFEMADRFQIPVILLSDQYLADSVQSVPSVDFGRYPQNRYITKSSPDYKRYTIEENGISPRAIPGYGEGLVCCDSDEHDERGQITEDYRIRETMVEKRNKKLERIREAAIGPLIRGEGEIAIIGWGSTKAVIEEAIAQIGDPRLFQVHFPWIYPLRLENLRILEESALNIVVENNSDAQFAKLLTLHNIRIDKHLLQANGFPFFLDQLTERIATMLKEIP